MLRRDHAGSPAAVREPYMAAAALRIVPGQLAEQVLEGDPGRTCRGCRRGSHPWSGTFFRHSQPLQREVPAAVRGPDRHVRQQRRGRSALSGCRYDDRISEGKRAGGRPRHQWCSGSLDRRRGARARRRRGGAAPAVWCGRRDPRGRRGAGVQSRGALCGGACPTFHPPPHAADADMRKRQDVASEALLFL